MHKKCKKIKMKDIKMIGPFTNWTQCQRTNNCKTN